LVVVTAQDNTTALAVLLFMGAVVALERPDQEALLFLVGVAGVQTQQDQSPEVAVAVDHLQVTVLEVNYEYEVLCNEGTYHRKWNCSKYH
jgi:hypothetical protein